MTEAEKANINQILCPQCSEPCKITFCDYYKITLAGCKNNHTTENITMSEYENIKKKQNLKNDKKHHVCETHNLNYEIYCEDCKKDLCPKCKEEHKEHSSQVLKEITPSKEEFKKNKEKLKAYIGRFKDNIKDVINQLNKAVDNIDKFYSFHDEIVDSFNDDNLYCEKANNLAEINNSLLDGFYVFNEMDFGYNLNKVLYISNEIEGKNIEIELNYKINKKGENDENGEQDQEGEENTIKILSPDFVQNNVNLCQIIHNGQATDLKDKMYLFDEDKEKEIYTIKLRGVNNLKNFNNMFYQCTNLISVSGLSKIDTSKIMRMGGMFNHCISLQSIDDISNWNMKNVTILCDMFSECKNLKSLPDISKWDVSNCTDMSSIFSGCCSLESLPDISNWDTRNVSSMNGTIFHCFFS